MRWYEGGIAQAITESKSKGAVFVVYIEGKDEKSQQITALINTEEVSSKLGSDNFVAIKVEADSLAHQQFSEFYKQTPVPSIYFIGKSGTPIQIVTESPTSASLTKAVEEVLEKAGIVGASQSLIDSEQTVSKPPPANVVCENGVCTIRREPPKEESQVEAGDQKELSAEEKVERAKKLLEAKQLAKEQEEKETERQRELERRKMGQEVQKMKKLQEDQELKQLKEDREKDKRLEKEAKDRVLAQIAQDKAERATRFQPAASSTPTAPPTTTTKDNTQPSTSKSDSNTARLQFKMPDGSSKTQDFPSTDKLLSVVNFVKANLNSGKFTLSTTFPRRQFTETDHSQTLADLHLTPNAVILVLPLNHGTVTTNQGPGGVAGFVWTVLAPLLGIFNFIKAFLGLGSTGHVSGDQPSTSSGSGANSEPDKPKPIPPSSGTTIRKEGNVRRLADIKKDDDDNNTWNGNSTQQM